jgi:hypothetical protein
VLFRLGRIERGCPARRHRLWAPRFTNADVRRLPAQTQELQHTSENAWLSFTFHATTLGVDPLVEPLRQPPGIQIYQVGVKTYPAGVPAAAAPSQSQVHVGFEPQLLPERSVSD